MTAAWAQTLATVPRRLGSFHASYPHSTILIKPGTRSIEIGTEVFHLRVNGSEDFKVEALSAEPHILPLNLTPLTLSFTHGNKPDRAPVNPGW